MKYYKYIIILFIIIGFLITLYPFISNIFNSKKHQNIILDYQSQVGNMTDDEKKRILDKYASYNKSYVNFLDTGELLGYINIPKININLPIYNGTTNEVLDKGVGLLENTSLPVGGNGNHSVLVAHTGLSKAKMFDDLNKLQLEDIFSIFILDRKLEYKINQIKVVKPDDVKGLEKKENEDYITLVTCTPYMVNSHRLLVRGVRISN